MTPATPNLGNVTTLPPNFEAKELVMLPLSLRLALLEVTLVVLESLCVDEVEVMLPLLEPVCRNTKQPQLKNEMSLHKNVR